MVIRGIVAAVAAALLAGPGVVLAKGGGVSAGAGVGVGLGGSAHVPGISGGASGSAHAGTNLNSNGLNSLDRDKGLDRAEDRRSVQGNLNANNRSSATRATGTARAEDRLDMRNETTVATTRDKRMNEAYQRWAARSK